ncbi:MAG TPA: sugar ABC transporter permease [Termitinemataceae bacterium]|uniref:carbohydrate ABC transporter permease n=1 Tax=Treponema sp. J25 TaxID=2094121 RepID=UPI00104D6330|nr:sugar ABC transporter permease [Treponema sp. J25]TCW61211.1 sugar ABC transporter permease [Treponema sp. J25]HOJ99837.1 sugar ABC transporter permease [Termitinemataceae bacterium]HOM24009.1 sugar ABC transporter permease [Termitinemataceae bacterium]HPQ00612.1 sugar ABC transporter permease [Termitinemataceae bacterium]
MNGDTLYRPRRVYRRRKGSIEQRKAMYGRIFIAPWVFGFIVYFALPLFTAVYYTLTKIYIDQEGLHFEWVGLQNYLYAFLQDPDFTRNLVESILNIVYQVPIIVFFSLFIASILKNDFRGRTLMRAIFFLPVIISSGVVISVLKENVLNTFSSESTFLFQAEGLNAILVRAGLNVALVKAIVSTISQIFDLTWKSGVQILLLLSALHAIPDSMYEAASIEGATGWEKFWKITFPLISPSFMLSIIYSIIDYFTDYSNKVMRMIVTTANQGKFEYSTTISITYFVAVMIIILIVNALLSRRTFYMV